MKAAIGNHKAIVESLVQAGADIDLKNKVGTYSTSLQPTK